MKSDKQNKEYEEEIKKKAIEEYLAQQKTEQPDKAVSEDTKTS